jgi:LacI family transcriptional regulator
MSESSTEGSAAAKAPTIIEVASLAGVSKSTVSNVIRGTPPVAERTRERVIAAIEHLGYRPNVLARQLREQRTAILGVLIGDLDNPFYAEVGKLVERWAFRSGYTAMFCNIEGEGARAETGVQTLLEHRVAGIVFLAFFGRSPAVRALLDPVPTVSIGLREEWGDSVAVDDARGATLAVDHLIGLGHTRLAYVTTAGVDARSDRARREGARRAVARAGLPALTTVRWEPGSEHARIGRRDDGLLTLFTGPSAVTAAFCSNDLAAIALLDFADRHGLSVPGDLSVVGFDNVSLAGLGRISLTTVAQPLDELARVGIETLLGRIDGDLTGNPISLERPVRLVERGSTGPPRRVSSPPPS